MNGGLRFMQGGAPQGGFSCGFAAIHLLPPTPPLQPSALAYVRWAVVSLPYGMGKSINFAPTLQNADQSKKKHPINQVLLCA